MAFKRPESALVVLFDQHYRILLLQRMDDANFWQSVTGSMEKGETPRQTARREVEEETGIALTDDQLVDCQHINRYRIRERWLHRYPSGTRYNTEHVFVAQIDSTLPITLTEHLDYQWLEKASAIKKLWSDSNKSAVKAFVPKG